MADEQNKPTSGPTGGNAEAPDHAVRSSDGSPVALSRNGGGKPGESSKYTSHTTGSEDSSDEKKEQPNPLRRIAIISIVAVLAIIGLIYGVNYYHYSQSHVATDDAYVTGDLVNVSPIIGGTLNKLTVEEGNVVKKGQLIGRLEDSGQLAALRQAKAAYDAAQSQLPQAESNLAYQKAATEAAIRRAQAGLQAQQARTFGAQQQVSLITQTTQDQVTQAQGQVQQARSQAAAADAQVATAQSAVRAARQAVRTAQQAVITAQRSADAVASQIAGAKANYAKATNDEKRYRTLLAQEAVTAQQYDAAYAAQQSAQSQLQALQDQSAQAKSQVEGARSQAEQARENVSQSFSQLAVAREQAASARHQIQIVQAGLSTARANIVQVPIQRTNVLNNQGQGSQAQADLLAAQAGRQEVALRRRQISTTKAQTEQAAAAYQNAKVTESNTTLYSPTDGTVVKKAVNVGAALSPGQTVVTITQGDYVWVEANFKETQLKGVQPNQPVEVSVDSFPGKVFKGFVKSINEATGASTALLPPDNATGNFTKVVQRIPVRIELKHANNDDDKKYARAEDIHALRQGMSVNAIIDTSSAKK